MNKELLAQMIDEKIVAVQKHDTADLFIYNYTALAQYGNIWNEVTLQCRGLIMDSAGNIVARPFKKFFNIEQVSELPSLPFEVYDKADGSLAVMYWVEDKPYIATRGSFNSDQAKHATQLLHTKYAHIWENLNKNHTYLLEIIYPENRICVDYGDMDDLILLAVIDTQTGEDQPLTDVGFPIVHRYDGVNDLAKLRDLELKNKEGFVVKFSNGFRVKMKFAEYVRLHRILTNVSNVVIWENMSSGKPLDEMLEMVPDEFYNYVRSVESELKTKYTEIEEKAKASFKVLGDRKETALYFKTQEHPSILFNMLDGKGYSEYIWKQIRPKFSKPFMKDEA